MKKLDVSKLINQVRLQPLLWDMSLDEYKRNVGKYEAWMDVCKAIYEGFEEKSDPLKKLMVQDAKRKWRTLRDNFLRSKKKQSRTHSQARKHRNKYVYWDLLQFLIPNAETQTTDTTTCKGNYPDLDSTEVSDFDPHELSRTKPETDPLYVDQSLLSVSQFKCEEIQIYDAEDTEIPVMSNMAYFTHDKEVEEFNIETLIDEVRVRPLLWDMSVDEFKDKVKKLEAWMKVCRAICEGFEEKSNTKKILMVQDVKSKWRTIRDNFLRSKRKQASTPPHGRKPKKYVYWDQLQFLVPDLIDPTTAHPSRKRVHPDISCAEVSDFYLNEDNGQSQTGSKRDNLCVNPRESFSSTSFYEGAHISDGENVILTNRTDFLTLQRNKTHLDEEVVMTNRVKKKPEAEPVKMLSEDEQFFNSLLSLVAELSDLQKLQFRIEVMQALGRAKKSS